MCQECGCGLPTGQTNIKGVQQHGHEHPHAHEHEHLHEHTHEHGHDHDHEHDHGHTHPHPHSHPHSHEHSHSHDEAGHTHEDLNPVEQRRVVEVRQAILEKNDRLAERNRGFFRGRGLLVLNVLSSPGSGKTTFIQKTLESLKGKLKAGVIVGDLATDNDAQRLKATGAPVVQITTGTVCHLEAEMVARSLDHIDLTGLELLIIENVGNLVCPASYDLGEDLRVVLLSVTEGEDKPLKYPPMFQSAQVAVISKIDLAEACGYSREAAVQNLQRMTPGAKIFELSAKTGKGMDAWQEYLLQTHAARKKASIL